MGSLSNLYISQSYQSLIHLATNNTASATLIDLQDGLGNSIGVSVNTGGDLYLSGSLTASLQQGYLYVGGASGRTYAFPTSSLVTNINTGSLVTTASFNSYTASNDSKVNQLINATSSYAISSSVAAVDAAQQSQINSLIAATGSYLSSSVPLTSLNAFTASQLTINSGYNTFTSSANQRLSSLETNSASVNISISALNTFTASQSTASIVSSITNLNTFTASAQISINALNINSASVNTSISNLNTTTASLNSSITQLNASSASQQISINAINAASSSWITESETGSFAYINKDNSWSANQTFTNITAISASFQYVQTLYETASVIYSSGSNQFGDELSDIQTLSGSVKVQGSLTVNGTPVLTSSADVTGFVTTSSFNAYTSSNNQRVSSLETNSASVNISISNINSTTASLNSSVSNLNQFSASNLISINALNTNSASVNSSITNLNQFTASQSTASIVSSITNLNQFSASTLTRLTNIETTTASLNSSITNINSFTQSANQRIGSLEAATSSYVTSAITASTLVTASFDNGTRNLTFTKGDASTFAVNIPDVSGSNIPNGTISSSAQITSLGFVSSSITASSLVTASVSLNTITFTKGDASTFNIIVNTGSAITTDITSLNAFTQSQETKNTTLENVTASLQQFTSSANSRLNSLESVTSSYAISSSVAAVDAAQQLQINSLIAATSSYADSASFAASQLAQDIRINSLSSLTASVNNSITSLNGFTASANSRLNNLESATSSYAISSSVAAVDAAQQSQIDNLISATGSYVTSSIPLTSLNAFTASQETKNTTLEGVTSSLQAFTQSQQNLNSTFATTGSNVFVGNQVIAGNISAISASFLYVQTTYETASVIYSSGSNQFGDELTDIQTLSGSVKVQGSLTVNGTNVLTSSIPLTSLNAFTQSQETKNTTLENVTASLQAFTASQQILNGTFATTASFNSYTQSNDQKVNSLIAATGSYATTGSNTFVGNQTISGVLHQSGTFYPDVVDWISSSIQLGTGSYILTTNNNGVTQYDNFQNIAAALQPYIQTGSATNTGSFATTGSNTFFGAQTFNINTQKLTITDNYNNAVEAETAAIETRLIIKNGDKGILRFNSTGQAVNAIYDIATFGSTNTGSLFIGTADQTFTYAKYSDNGLTTLYNKVDLSGSLNITGSISASLPQGFVLVGDASNRTILVATSSFGGGGSTDITSLNAFTQSILGTNPWTASIDQKFATIGGQSGSWGGGGGAISVQDEGTILGNATSFNFNGAGVTATLSSGTASITIPGGGGGTIDTGSFLTTGSFNTSQNVRGALNIYPTGSTAGQAIRIYNTGSNISGSMILGITDPGSPFIQLQQRTWFQIQGSDDLNYVAFTASFDNGLGIGPNFGSRTQMLTSSGSLGLFNPTIQRAGVMNHLSASITARNGVNLVFADNTRTGTTIISGSDNIFTNPATPTPGYIRYIGGSNNLYLNSSNGVGTQITASAISVSGVRPTMNNNIFNGTGNFAINQAVNGGTHTYSNNIDNGTVTINAMAFTGSLTLSNNVNANGTFTITPTSASVAEIASGLSGSHTITMQGNGIFGGGIVLTTNRNQPPSVSYTISNNVLGGGAITITNASSSLAVNASNNITNGTISYTNAGAAGLGIHRTAANINSNYGSLNLIASASTISAQGNICTSALTVINRAYTGSFGSGSIAFNNNMVQGAGNTYTVSGSYNGTQQGSTFVQNAVFGTGNTFFTNVEGRGNYVHFASNGIFGSNLILTGSNNTVLSEQGGAHIGRWNANDGIRNTTGENIFSVGTGTSTTRKTGFLIDSGSNTFVEGTFNVSGSTTLTGSLSIQSGSALPSATGSSVLTWDATTGQVGQVSFNTLLSSSLSVGEFYNSTTLSGSAGVSQSVYLPITGVSNGLSIQNNSQIVTTQTGTYNIQFSAQCDAFGGADTIWIWFKKNGVNIADSASKLIMQNNTAAIMTVNIFDNATAGDYYEVVWQNNGGTGIIVADAASGNIPAIPSVIVTINEIR